MAANKRQSTTGTHVTGSMAFILCLTLDDRSQDEKEEEEEEEEKEEGGARESGNKEMKRMK